MLLSSALNKLTLRPSCYLLSFYVGVYGDMHFLSLTILLCLPSTDLSVSVQVD